MDATGRLEYHVRDLATHSVTLSPNRALVVREIKDVPLNAHTQLTIVGLAPSVDEQSIRVEGVGAAAIITDMTVENRPNREIFDDFHPEEDVEDDRISLSDLDFELGIGEQDGITSGPGKDLEKKLQLLCDEQKSLQEGIESATAQLKMLDSYNKLLTRKDNIAEAISVYRREREKLFQDQMTGSIKEREINNQIEEVRKEILRLAAMENMDSAKAVRARESEKRKKSLRRAEAAKERQRIRKEQEYFWPKSVFVIKVSLAAATNFTPSSSRRSSVSSDMIKLEADTQAIDDKSTRTCDLTISYATSYAYWTPTYDLALSTTTNSGTLYFDAKLTNQTSETWSDCKVTLSTSQTEFTDLKEEVPVLTPWTIRLASKNTWSSGNEILYSREEQTKKAKLKAQKDAKQSQRPRRELFGVDHTHDHVHDHARDHAHDEGPPSAFTKALKSIGAAKEGARAPGGSGPMIAQSSTDAITNTGMLLDTPMMFARKSRRSGISSVAAGLSSRISFPSFAGRPRPESMSFVGIQSTENPTIAMESQPGYDQEEAELRELQEEMMMPECQEPEPTLQESLFEETGLTSTYELPGHKTLVPSATAPKQRVASIAFTSVAFSHTVVAKYRPAAYLQARLRNGSRMALLPGETGLTLDGCFLGHAKLPRCSPGETFTLGLGTDPAIQVAYPKPDVRRSQTGGMLVTREDSQVYTRTITLTNTRAGGDRDDGKDTDRPRPVSLKVLDQVPVSEDERLRIDVLQPRSLVLGGPGVSTGVSGSWDRNEKHKPAAATEGKQEQNKEKDWGKALATLKKGGEVTWDVSLNAGQTVKLTLEYECSCRTGEHAVNA